MLCSSSPGLFVSEVCDWTQGLDLVGQALCHWVKIQSSCNNFLRIQTFHPWGKHLQIWETLKKSWGPNEATYKCQKSPSHLPDPWCLSPRRLIGKKNYWGKYTCSLRAVLSTPRVRLLWATASAVVGCHWYNYLCISNPSKLIRSPDWTLLVLFLWSFVGSLTVGE